MRDFPDCSTACHGTVIISEYGVSRYDHNSSICSKTIVYILTLVMLNIFKCMSEFYHVICQYSSYKYIILKKGAFRNRENLQYKKRADSVLLSLFMRTYGKCNNSRYKYIILGFQGHYHYSSICSKTIESVHEN